MGFLLDVLHYLSRDRPRIEVELSARVSAAERSYQASISSASEASAATARLRDNADFIREVLRGDRRDDA